MLRIYYGPELTGFKATDEGSRIGASRNPQRVGSLFYTDVHYGFYTESDTYSIFHPSFSTLLLASTMHVNRISYVGLTKDDPTVLGMGCGQFVCESGTVGITKCGVSREINIVASSQENFNATVRALKNGELKPVGSEQTVVQKLNEKIKYLDHELRTASDLYGNRGHEIHLLKNRNWWQRLWNLQPKPFKAVDDNLEADCYP